MQFNDLKTKEYLQRVVDAVSVVQKQISKESVRAKGKKQKRPLMYAE